MHNLTEKRDSEDNQSINIMSRDFIYRAPFSNPPIELRAGNEALLIKTRLVLSYRKCNIQPKLTSHWSDHQSLYHHQHHHHNHPSQQQCSHHHNHHRQCWRKNWKTKEDSGFIEVDSDEVRTAVIVIAIIFNNNNNNNNSLLVCC